MNTRNLYTTFAPVNGLGSGAIARDDVRSGRDGRVRRLDAKGGHVVMQSPNPARLSLRPCLTTRRLRMRTLRPFLSLAHAADYTGELLRLRTGGKWLGSGQLPRQTKSPCVENTGKFRPSPSTSTSTASRRVIARTSIPTSGHVAR